MGGSGSARLVEQAAAALAYGATSLCIMLFNKIVLSVYGFPSFTFLALAQFIITAGALFVLRAGGWIAYVPIRSWLGSGLGGREGREERREGRREGG